MPNIIIEISHQQLISQPDTLLRRLNQALWQSGHFKQANDIKARIYTPNNALIGLDTATDDAFIMVHFYLMSGRDDATIKQLAETIAQTINQHLVDVEKFIPTAKLQICVNPTVLSHNYVKQII